MALESKSDDSQASQLLAAALRARDVQPGPPLINHHPVQESPLLSDSNASVHYQIHGLAATQSVYSSQDQPYTEGSQKENTPASWDKDRPSQPLPPSPPASPPRSQLVPSYTTELKDTPSNIFPLSTAAKEKPCSKDFVLISDPSGKAVSLNSPSRLPPRPQPHLGRTSIHSSRAMLPPPRPRSPSPPSQDSFAGPLPQPDPAQAFIATARNFNIPLSQVGEVSQSPSEEDGPPPVSSNIRSFGEQDYASREPSPPPRILVAATPSDLSRGSDSQDQSQANPSQSQQLESHSGDSQYSDLFPQAQAQTDDYMGASSPPNDEVLGVASRSSSSQPSSSYERLLADPFEDIPVATQIGDDITPPTQTIERTQMDSQEGDVDTVMRGHHYYNENSQMVFPTVPSEARSTHTSHSTVRRGFLGMIAPEKRYRYTGMASEAAGPSMSRATPRTTGWDVEPANDTQASDAPSSDGVHTQDTQLTDRDEVGETQPSDVAVNGSVTSLLPRRRLPPANRVLQPGHFLSLRMGPAAAKVIEPDVSLDPDVTGPTQIVSPSPDKTGPTQIVSPPPNETGPTQLVSPSPAETGPTEIASPLSDRTGLTQPVSPSPEKTGPTQIVSPSPARRGRTRMFSRSPVKSSPTKVVPDSDPPEPGPVAPLMRRRGPSVSSASTYHSPEVALRARAYMQSEDEVLKTIAATEPLVPKIDVEEEEEEEEEEIPLAQQVPSAKAKGKQKVTESNVKSPYARNTIARGNANNSSWRGGVIPSSDPGERSEEVVPKAAAGKNTKPRTPMNQVLPPPMSRSTRAAKTAARGRLAESSDSEGDQDRDDDDDMSSLTEVATTVPADDDDMDVDLPPDPNLKPARGNKRKRTVPSSAKKVNGRVLVKGESSTPLGRPVKRIKTEGGGADAPTRVFALWKGTAQYYSGTVHQVLGHGAGRYVVRFDDDDSAELELKHLRACRPKPGDHVLLRERKKAVVVECPPCPEAGYGPDDTVMVKLKDDEQEEVQVRCLHVATRTISAEWDDRMLGEDAIMPVVRPNIGVTPGSRSVSASGQSEVARKRALAGIGLVVSLAPSKEAQSARDTMVGDIKKCGGVVLDDWTTIFGMEGTLEHKNQRWMLRKEDIQWRKKAGHGIDKVFLISDDFHQKPKYLVALALGIPCLSVDWLRAFVEQNQQEAEWRPHLLPAGYSEQLEARVSQMVDIDWGTSDHHVTDVAANKVASKVFSDMSILCISADFVPSKKSKKSGDSASRKEAAESVPRIVLCMGAATVESVADLKHASQDPSEYDYIVVPDQNLSKYSAHENAVHVNWVKDCLISGRLLPLPG